MFALNTILRKGNSSHWIQQQANDHFVLEARKKGYIARSAFKLQYINDRFQLFDKKSTNVVIDLGCSPGGWCQIIRESAGDECHIIGLDLLPVKAAISNAVFLQGDFNSPDVQRKLLLKLKDAQASTQRPPSATAKTEKSHKGGPVDVVTSDMCPNREGGTQDRQRIAELNLSALKFSIPLLREGGHFVCKVLGSRPSFEELYRLSERYFLKTQICKPPASRVHSDESFLVCLGRLSAPRVTDLRRTAAPNSPSVHSYGLDDWPGFARRPRTKK